DRHEVVVGEGVQLDPDREATLKLGNEVGWLDPAKRARPNKQNVIGFDWTISGADRRSFDDREKIPLHALSRHVGTNLVAPADDLVDLINEDDGPLLDLLDRAVHHLIPIDQLIGLFLNQEPARFLDRKLA